MTIFGRLAAEVYVKSTVERQTARKSTEVAELPYLSQLLSHVHLREHDLFTRLSTLDHLRTVFSEKEGDEAAPWHSIAALAVKDFHVDAAALMDSLAAVAIQATTGIKGADRVKLPGFASIQSGTNRSYREGLPENVREVIDSAERWWPFAKRVRDIVSHRQHQKIAFGHASQGVLFQLYEGPLERMIVAPAFLWNENVADFTPYSSYVLAEILVFMDELGRCLADAMGWSIDGLNLSYSTGDFTDLIAALERLRESLGVRR